MIGAKPKPNGMQMLNALLKNADRLTDQEHGIFSDMRERFYASTYGSLTPAQTAWIERVYKRLELDADEEPENLVSSGRVSAVPESRRKVYDFELMERPLKPPPRKPG
jgi:hypothetical protein